MPRRWIVLFVALVLAIAVWLAWRSGPADEAAETAQAAIRAATPAASGEDAAAAARTASDPTGEPRAPVAETPRAAASAGAVDDERLLRGRVVDLAGAPVADASVELSLCADDELSSLDLVNGQSTTLLATATTAADGEFAFEAVPGRAHRVTARADSFAPGVLPFCYAGRRVELRLGAPATLRGRVVRAADSMPVAGARVTLRRRDGGVRTDARETASDADGRFGFDGLFAGAGSLDVHPTLEASRSGVLVELTAGQATDVEVTVEGGATISGRVIDASTQLPIAGAQIAEQRTFERVVESGADGAYVYPGYSGNDIALAARAPGYASATRRRGAQAPSAAQHVDFALTPEHRVSGRVVDEAGTAVPQAYVAAAASDFGGERRSQRLEWSSTFTGERGEFELGALSGELRHVLVVRKPGFGTAVYDFPERERDERVLELGELVLPRAHSVVGILVDERDEPVAGLEVVLRGSHAARTCYAGAGDTSNERWLIDTYVAERRGRSDERGRFGFAEVAAGSYRIKAMFVGEHDEVAVEVEVPLVNGEPVKLVLVRGLSIDGRVTVPDGGALPTVYVRADADDPRHGRRGDVPCARDGSFHVLGLSDTHHSLMAYSYPSADDEHTGRLFLPTEVHGVAAGRKDVVIELRLAERIVGRVVDLDGHAVAGALVEVLPEGAALAVRTDHDGRFALALAVAPGDVFDLRARRELTTGGLGRNAFAREDDPTNARLAGVRAGGPAVELKLDWRP